MLRTLVSFHLRGCALIRIAQTAIEDESGIHSSQIFVACRIFQHMFGGFAASECK